MIKRGKMVRQISQLFEEKTSWSQRLSDKLTETGGSWGFITFFFAFLLAWIAVNIYAGINQWDPYPFILLNLLLSCLAAVQAPIILMSQNRQAQKDRLKAEFDLAVNIKAEEEIQNMQQDLEIIKGLIRGIYEQKNGKRQKGVLKQKDLYNQKKKVSK